MTFFLLDPIFGTKILTKQSNVVIAIDNSTSTKGNVLDAELQIAKKISAQFEHSKFILWNNRAKFCDIFTETVESEGGTNPVKFVDLMATEKISCDFLVLLTDGDIENIEEFRSKLSLVIDEKVPIVVIMVFPTEKSVLCVTEDCNMSIAEACLSVSSNIAACTMIATEQVVRVFYATGYFCKFLKPCSTSISKTLVSEFSEICVEDLPMPITFTYLPPGVIACDDGRFIVIDSLIEQMANPIFGNEQEHCLAYALEQAMSRTNLPMLPVDQMIVACQRLIKEMQNHTSSSISLVQQELFKLLLCIEPDVKAIAAIQEQISTAKNTTKQTAISAELQQAVEFLSNTLIHYSIDKSQFAYNCNLQEEDSPKVSIPNSVTGQCPITQKAESVGVFFFAVPPSFVKLTRNANAALTSMERRRIAKYFSRKIMRQQSSICGAAMRESLGRGIFGTTFATSECFTNHPISGYPLLGFLPLSLNLKVFTLALSRLFCGGNLSPHLLRAYVAMVASLPFPPKELLEHAKYVFHCLSVERESICNALTNMELLHHMNQLEAKSIINIALQLDPQFKFDKNRALSIVNFVHVYRKVRKEYIGYSYQGRDPLCIFGECFDSTGQLRIDLYGKIAAAFGSIHQKHGHRLRLKSFQSGLDEILQIPTLKRIYNGETLVEQSTENMIPQIPELPNDSHFDLAIWDTLFRTLNNKPSDGESKVVESVSMIQSVFGGISAFTSRLIYGPSQNFQCIFCKAKFCTDRDRWAHINEKLGPYNLDLSRVLLYNKKALLRENVMPYLQKRYGADRFVIYSHWIREIVKILQTILLENHE